MKRYFTVLKAFFKFSFMNLTVYRGDMFFRNFGYLLESGILLLFFNILYLKITEINGWGFNDLLLILAAYNLLDWLIYFLYEQNHRDLHRKVNRGELDMILVKPIDSQIVVSFRDIEFQSMSGLIIGSALIVYVLKTPFYLSQIFSYFFLFFIGVTIHYSVSLMIACFSFFSPKLEELRHLEGRFRDLTFFPTDIYPPFLRFVFMTFLPIAFFTTVPAKAFSQPSFRLIIEAVLVMIIFVFLSRKFFSLSLRRYSSASS